MLYVFLGYPQTFLNAGGLQHCVEQIEELAILEHDPATQYRKEGVFAASPSGDERIGELDAIFSPSLLKVGITWDWFPENWRFGNGVTVHKTTAMREFMTVDHGSGQSFHSLLASGQVLDVSRMRLQRIPQRTEGWAEYESRWLPGTCPQESHIVHMTWLVTKHRLAKFAYDRLQAIVESPETVLKNREQYDDERHFSVARKWMPQQAVKGAIPL